VTTGFALYETLILNLGPAAPGSDEPTLEQLLFAAPTETKGVWSLLWNVTKDSPYYGSAGSVTLQTVDSFLCTFC
jgi:hypothetical protein